MLPADQAPPPSPRQLVLPTVTAMLAQLRSLLPAPDGSTLGEATQADYVMQQCAQALQVVGLHAAARVFRTMQTASTHPASDRAQRARAVHEAVDAISHYLQTLPTGEPTDGPDEPDAIAALFEPYRALVRLSGADTAQPSDLWTGPAQPAPSLRLATLAEQGVALPPPADAPTADAPAQLRAQLDAHVLELVKTADAAAAQALSQLALRLAEQAASVALEQFWCLAAAWFEAIARDLDRLDVSAKRLASRLLLQYAIQAKGGTHTPEALMRELLYRCDRAARASTAALPTLLHRVCEHSAIPRPTPEPEAATTTAAALEIAPTADQGRLVQKPLSAEVETEAEPAHYPTPPTLLDLDIHDATPAPQPTPSDGLPESSVDLNVDFSAPQAIQAHTPDQGRLVQKPLSAEVEPSPPTLAVPEDLWSELAAFTPAPTPEPEPEHDREPAPVAAEAAPQQGLDVDLGLDLHIASETATQATAEALVEVEVEAETQAEVKTEDEGESQGQTPAHASVASPEPVDASTKEGEVQAQLNLLDRLEHHCRALEAVLLAWVQLPPTRGKEAPVEPLAQPEIEAATAAAAADPAELLRQALIHTGELIRQTWTAGAPDISTLVRTIEQSIERLHPQRAPTPVRQICVRAAAEVERLLFQFAAKTQRRANPQVVQTMQRLATELLAAPIQPHAQRPAPAASQDAADDPNAQPTPPAHEQENGPENTPGQAQNQTENSPAPDQGRLVQKSISAEVAPSNEAALANPETFAVFDDEFRTLWPVLRQAQADWQRAAQRLAHSAQWPAAEGDPTPEQLAASAAEARQSALRALHTLKASAQLAGAHAWGQQVHAIETHALAPDADPAALAAPLQMLWADCMALTQAVALRHPDFAQRHDGPAQSLQGLQRLGQGLWKNHARAQAAFADAGRVLAELQSTLARLHTLAHRSADWADALMLQTQLDLPYELHEDLGDLLATLHGAQEDLGTIHRQLQHGQAHTAGVLAEQATQLQTLQNTLLEAQQVPLASLEPRLRATLELAAAETGRSAQLLIEGGTQRLHRDTAQAIAPLLDHLIRNSFAHGLEDAATRRAAHKPELGCITISLRSTPLRQTLTLEDDGAGLDVDAIWAKAQQLGLIPPSLNTPSDAERAERAAALICHPGLSTAAALTPLAGRGIGMDAVDAGVRALGGQLRIDSVRGVGCRFHITLAATARADSIVALTLAHPQGGHWRMGVPESSIWATLHISAQEADAALEAGLLRHPDHGAVPLYAASAVWGAMRWAHDRQPDATQRHAAQAALALQLPPGQTLTQPVLIVRGPTGRWALLVDAAAAAQTLIVEPPADVRVEPPAGLLGTAIEPSGQVLQIWDAAASILAHEARLARAAAGEAVPDEHAPTASDAQRPRPLVMLVDDSLSVRRLAQHLLQSQGYAVVTFADAFEALAHLENSAAFVLQTAAHESMPSSIEALLERVADRIDTNDGQVSCEISPNNTENISPDNDASPPPLLRPTGPKVDLGRGQPSDSPSSAAQSALHPSPDMLLVDIEMPDMNGLDLLRKLRADDRWRHVPIVMLTAHQPGPVSHKAIELGAQAWLTKPYSPEELLAQVRRYCAPPQ